jgi:phage terminase large subunit
MIHHNSSKSWSVARFLIACALNPGERILCCREVQRSIKDSVHRLIGDQIQLMGLGQFFDITRDEIRCITSGSMFVFTGLATNTVESIKSFEAITRCWVEEGQTVSEKSWSLLIPTIRAPKSEIIITMNPVHDDDPTYVRFIKNRSDLQDIIVIQINATDNPWFPEVLKTEMNRLKAADYDEYCHIWLGETKHRSNDVVLDRDKLHLAEFEVQSGWSPLYGVDWGYAADPTVMIRAWFDAPNHALYVDYETVQFHCENDMLVAWFDTIPDARSHVVRADNARPEHINFCRRSGYKKMTAARKWPGCDMDGVDYLRSLYDIYVHPRCPYTYAELRSLRYRTDKHTGDVLPGLDTKMRRKAVTESGEELSVKDDACDAIRYSIEPLILGFKQKIPECEEAPMLDQLGHPMQRVPDQIMRQQIKALARPNGWMY